MKFAVIGEGRWDAPPTATHEEHSPTAIRMAQSQNLRLLIISSEEKSFICVFFFL